MLRLKSLLTKSAVGKQLLACNKFSAAAQPVPNPHPEIQQTGVSNFNLTPRYRYILSYD